MGNHLLTVSTQTNTPLHHLKTHSEQTNNQRQHREGDKSEERTATGDQLDLNN